MVMYLDKKFRYDFYVEVMDLLLSELYSNNADKWFFEKKKKIKKYSRRMEFRKNK